MIMISTKFITINLEKKGGPAVSQNTVWPNTTVKVGTLICGLISDCPLSTIQRPKFQMFFPRFHRLSSTLSQLGLPLSSSARHLLFVLLLVTRNTPNE